MCAPGGHVCAPGVQVRSPGAHVCARRARMCVCAECAFMCRRSDMNMKTIIHRVSIKHVRTGVCVCSICAGCVCGRVSRCASVLDVALDLQPFTCEHLGLTEVQAAPNSAKTVCEKNDQWRPMANSAPGHHKPYRPYSPTE